MDIKCKYHPEVKMIKDAHISIIEHFGYEFDENGNFESVHTSMGKQAYFCPKCGYIEQFLTPEFIKRINDEQRK
jgi:hypothetical protein